MPGRVSVTIRLARPEKRSIWRNRVQIRPGNERLKAPTHQKPPGKFGSADRTVVISDLNSAIFTL
jgi:hypothetical protein